MISGSFGRFIVWASATLTLLCGILLLGCAGYVVLTEGALSGSKSIVIISAFGFSLFVVGIIGVSMAVTGSPLLKILYVSLLLLLIAAELVVVIASFTTKIDINPAELWKAMGSEAKIKIQKKVGNYKCCGYNNHLQSEGVCLYMNTCQDVIFDMIEDNYNIISNMFIIVFCLQILNILCSTFYASSSEERVNRIKQNSRSELVSHASRSVEVNN